MGFTIYWMWRETPEPKAFAKWCADVGRLIEYFNVHSEFNYDKLSIRGNKNSDRPLLTKRLVEFSAYIQSENYEEAFRMSLDDLNPKPNLLGLEMPSKIELYDKSPVTPFVSSDWWKTGGSSFDVLVMAVLIRLTYYFPSTKIQGGDWSASSLLCQEVFGVGEIPPQEED